MKAWRLARARYGPAVDGAGGRRVAGRWNSKGSAICYCAECAPLAVLEIRVHVARYADLPADLRLYELDIPDDLPSRRVTLGELPVDWTKQEQHTRAMGDAACASGALAILIVPSAVVHVANNVLVLGSHPGWRRVRVIAEHDLALDRRLFD